MKDHILGFLNIKGWAGVEAISIIIAVGSAIGLLLLYYFLVYTKTEKPRKITLRGNVVKIFLLLLLIVLLVIF